MKTIRDAIHGDIELDELEMQLIDTPAIQRLRGVKQLGTSNLVYPSAMHSRFEHSLGTCWVTKQILTALDHSGYSVAPEERRIATLAALLHDVTHVPFGHTFEDERRLFPRHDEDQERIAYFLDQPQVAAVLRASGVGERIRKLFLHKAADTSNPLFVHDLVMGTVCADLLDYLLRDAFHCGLDLGYDERLYKYFAIADGRLVVKLHKNDLFRRDALSELVHLLQIRYSLTERVYFHHAKVVAGAMVSRALELALEAGQFQREELYELRDDSLFDRLERKAPPVSGISDILTDLKSRRLYKRVYLLTLAGLGRSGLSEQDRDALAARFHSNLEERRRVERRLASELGIPEAHIIIYCPSPSMSLKEANVPVETAAGVVRPLSELRHPDVEALKEKHRGLWRFYVCLRRDYGTMYEKAGKLCEALIGHFNQLDRLTSGNLAFREE